MATTGHENEAINVQDLKASLQKFKTDISDKKYVNKTWAQLKAMRDGGTLLAGQWYRITDYTCTTTQEDTQSAGHQFDIIVRADDVNVLNENAYAALHAGDTYFANCNLAAWKLRYTIDNVYWSLKPVEYITFTLWGSQKRADYIGTEVINDTEYYKWHVDGTGYYYTLTKTVGDYTYTYNYGSLTQGSAIESYVYNEEEGKGTILGMIDEFDNDCPYDFKNIQFKRWMVTDSKGRSSINNFYMGAQTVNLPPSINIPDTSDFIWAYTFSSSKSGGVQTDYSLSEVTYVYNNIIKRRDNNTLPNNVFFGDYCYFNTFGDNCTSNTFDYNCNSNTFGNYCRSNIFGYNCYSNTFGNYCYSNTFGRSCISNTFGNNCTSNTFSNESTYNTFGNGCNYNTIGYYCTYNTIGYNCTYNTFGNNCNYNTIGNYCTSNTFGYNCYSNTFGNYCYSNTFGNNCNSNTLGNNCNSNTISKEYSFYNIIENGNQNITLTSTQTTSGSNLLCNIKICQGVNNTSTRKTISHDTVGDTFQTEYKPVGSQVVNV